MPTQSAAYRSTGLTVREATPEEIETAKALGREAAAVHAAEERAIALMEPGRRAPKSGFTYRTAQRLRKLIT